MAGYDDFRILVDLPATRPALGFDATAKGLASLIRRSEPQFAIAIFGPWGSGKTTLMNAIRNRLRGQRIIKAEFSAWRYEREEHLILPLLDTIRAALVDWSREARPDGDNSDGQGGRLAEAARDTAQTVGRVMASLLAGLSFKVGLPGALDLSYDANKALAAAREPAPAPTTDRFAARLRDADLPQSVYHAAFTALAEAFAHFDAETGGARIVVFVDDLDRCLPEGTLQVLESMKLFFDLRGFVFVVGLDREIVERCIDVVYGRRAEAEGEGALPLVRGSEYIKKIFQVPYSLAPVSLSLLDDLFRSLKRDSRLPAEQVTDLEQRVRPHLAYLFAETRVNPREVKRYLNAYVIQMKVKPDLDPDVVLVLNTLAFRHDCAALSDAVETFREETAQALRRFVDGGDASALEDVGLQRADLPNDVRTYLRTGGIGRCLLTVEDLGPYLDSGAATRSSSGGYGLEILEDFRHLKGEVMQAMEAPEPLQFDAAWSSANSRFQSLVSQLERLLPGALDSIKGGTKRPGSTVPELRDVASWLDASNESAWTQMLAAMNEPADGARLEELRSAARNEARARLDALLRLIREQRRRENLHALS